MTTLFFDFDGTIIDCSQRYWQVHLYCLDGLPAALNPDDYWNLKRLRIPEQKILDQYYPSLDRKHYLKERHDIIEAPQFLGFDTLMPGIVEALTRLKANHELILVTLRKNTQGLLQEVENLGLSPLFADIRTSPSGNDAIEAKIALLRLTANAQNWVIGDTEADILAGKALNYTTCALLSGIRTKKFLASLAPDHLLGSLTELPTLLGKSGE